MAYPPTVKHIIMCTTVYYTKRDLYVGHYRLTQTYKELRTRINRRVSLKLLQ